MAKRQSMRGRGADAFFNPPAPQETGEPVRQHASTPVSTDAAELVKATFCLKPDKIMKLEQLLLARRQQGRKVDKSALVR